MRIRGFVGGSYTLQSVPIDCQRSVNLFPQVTESHTQADGEIGALISTPGLRLLGTCGSGPIRCMYLTSTGVLAIVSGSELYQVGSGWTFTLAGTLSSNSGPVNMVDNGSQLMVVDGASGYIVTLATGVFERITSAGFPGANSVGFVDSFFVCNYPGTNQFIWSNGFDGLTWDASNFYANLTPPDAVLGVIVFNRQLWVFGRSNVQSYWNTGADTQFSRLDGSSIEQGCSSIATVKVMANSIMWLGCGSSGIGIVWRAQGYQPTRVSNHGVELAIQSWTDLSLATAWVYQEDGHAFYILNHPDATSSWCYDIATGNWHERAYLEPDGTFSRHRAECYAFAYDEHCVGDYANGNIYALDASTYTDNGNPLVRMRRAPHLSVDGHRIFFSKFQLMAQVGVGLDASPAVGVDPHVELRYSDDFGNTWSTPQARSLGTLGSYAQRVIWRRLGQSRTRVFEVRVSDPVAVSILGADLDAQPGVS